MLTLLLLAAAASSDPLLCAPGSGPHIVAHRARRDVDRPENSLAEMKATVTAAPYMLEIDLSETRDGVIRLLHDDDLDRTTNGHGPLAAITSNEAAKLRLKDSAEPPPRFDTAARWAARNPGATLMLDIKKVPPARIAPIADRVGMTGRVLLLTFDRKTTEAAIAADPIWRISALVRSSEELRSYQALFGDRPFVAYLPTFSPTALFAEARAAGVTILTDAMSGGMASPDKLAASDAGAYRRYLADRPADLLVTDHATRLPACVR
ncbi:glycerophosphodiester phosphodiesterase family protein [Sphingomonas crocodyli]|uniref:Glycerophosphodiester phosphodiesterase family protein n=1 Tax=Sphingomonas crocodyli TaxID=1979270 RepID=A0A437M8B5_9SPHN|nr:glycerophosphodiester phosphodiesterase family protein [Sphingomonas crocodyli]RVT93951.1 glycerophosphodiester phosphodiesterase family protein [Sphingomonas crocodyli]